MAISNLFIDNDYHLFCGDMGVRNRVEFKDIAISGALQNNLSVQQDIGTGRDLIVTQDLNVAGETRLTGNVTMGSDLKVDGSITTTTLTVNNRAVGLSQTVTLPFHYTVADTVEYTVTFTLMFGLVYVSFLSKADVNILKGFAPYFSDIPVNFTPDGISRATPFYVYKDGIVRRSIAGVSKNNRRITLAIFNNDASFNFAENEKYKVTLIYAL